MTTRSLTSRAIAVLLLLGAGACSASHHSALDETNDDSKVGGKGTAGTSGSASDLDLPNPLLPAFPGGGTSDASDPLPNGMICDSVSVAGPIPKQRADCFFDDKQQVAATLEQVLECAEDNQTNTVHLRLTFQPWFVDNTYGANAIDWASDTTDPAAGMAAPAMGMMPPKMGMGMGMAMPPKMDKGMPKMGKPGKGGHTFMDLVGSDHAEFIVTDANGKIVLQFKLDYFSEDASRPSGYGSLGVYGGDGKMILGDAAAIVQWSTSLDRNFNERGYSSYTVDSPATDADYTPNSATPEWDYRVVYEAWIDLDAFGTAGFGGANIEFVHASPSKIDNNTIEVIPGDCPPKLCGENPDDDCGNGEPPTSPDAGIDVPCVDSPSGDDQACHVD